MIIVKNICAIQATFSWYEVFDMTLKKIFVICALLAMTFMLCACSDVLQIGGSNSNSGGTHQHVYYDATCTAPKTCKICKDTLGSAKGHDWTGATCSAPKTCKSCHETVGDKAEHTWQKATTTTPKMCSECGVTEGEPLGVVNGENYKGKIYTGGSSSTRYHYEENCAGKYSHEITWEDVESKGLTPCGTCVAK